MSILVHDCPHCPATHVSFAVVAITRPDSKAGRRTAMATLHLRCPSCCKPAGALIQSKTERPQAETTKLKEFTGDPTRNGWELKNFWPDPDKPQIPEHLPDPLSAILTEAEENRMLSRWHAAGLTYGKALDIAFKKVNSTLTKGTLQERIKKLGDSGRITPELAMWAQGLRGIRNEATHGEEPLSDDDIEKLAAATRLLLTYLFTLPGMLAEVSGNPAVVPAPPAKAKP